MASTDKLEQRKYLADTGIPEVMDGLVQQLLHKRPPQDEVAKFIQEHVAEVCSSVKPAAPAPTPTPAGPPPPAAPPQAAPPLRRESFVARPKAAGDGTAAASRVVGSTAAKPRGPSPDDALLLSRMEKEGTASVLSGVRCHVPYKVTVVHPESLGAAARKVAEEVVDSVLTDVQSIFSHFDPASEISKINSMQPDSTHVCSDHLKTVLEAVLQLYQHSRGSFDPGVLPLSKYFWAAPDSEAPEEVRRASSWSSFTYKPDGTLQKKYRESSLDLCGIAKGWAIDEIARGLADKGIEDFYVDWGGDIKVGGKHPAGRLWNVMVVRPPPIGEKHDEATCDHIARIDLQSGTAVATSGDYMQTIAAGRFQHVISAKTQSLIPINDENMAQVCVVSSSCMIADGLATAALAMKEPRSARMFLDGVRGAVLKEGHVRDYLLYARGGPRIVRMRLHGVEDAAALEERRSKHKPAHIIVVGGGLAGVSAAIQATKCDAKVTIIEREKRLGGNSAKATSGINAVGTRTQYQQGVGDDERFFERDTFFSAKGGNSDTGLVRTLAARSASAVHWLVDELGVPLTVLSQLGGHSKKRSHRAPPRPDGKPIPIGFTIMQHAIQHVETALADQVSVLKGCRVQRLLSEGAAGAAEEVRGVEYVDEDGKPHQITADAVVLTTGGFGFDHSEGSLMSEFRKDLVGVPTTCGPWTDGSGVRLGREIGATLIDMDKVQEHPTALMDPKDPFAHTKYLGPEALRGSGGILLNHKGCRFVDELNLRSVVSKAILDNCESRYRSDGKESRPYAWCLLNQEMQDKFGRPLLLFYRDKCGLFQDCADVAELAKVMECDQATLEKTLDDYGKAYESGVCGSTHKKVFPASISSSDKGFTVARVTPCIHYCMGGLQISASAEVQRPVGGALGKKRPLRRLFAAGEVTGGVHGGNRLGGNSLLECAVVGRIAGERAATVNQEPTCLKRDQWQPLVLREMRETDTTYGQSTRVYRFNLHGALQRTGLEVGQFIAIRGDLDGETLQGFYSPISRPDDVGCIDILCRVDSKGGPIVEFLKTLRPGQEAYLKAMGGLKLVPTGDGGWLHGGRRIRRINMLAGGTGIAPMLQIIRSYVRALSDFDLHLDPRTDGLRLLYAAEEGADLAFAESIQKVTDKFPGMLEYYFVLNSPPLGWTQGVGFIEKDTIRSHLWFPATDDTLNVICGPPIFDKFMTANLKQLGFSRQSIYAFSQDPIA